MTTPKTIRVKRDPAYSNRYDSEDRTVGVYVTGGQYSGKEELDITITVPKSLKQQRREARLKALIAPAMHLSAREALEIIEHVDAEFDRERAAEVREKLSELLQAFYQALAASEDHRQDAAILERNLDAIEAIYRGER